MSRRRKEGDWQRARHVKRRAFRRFSCPASRRTRLRWHSRCDMRVGDRIRLRACLECLCVHRGCHLLSNLFLPCDAQVFLITLSAVCLETAMDELVGVARSRHRDRVRARVVSTASLLGPLCGRSACPQSGTGACACVARHDGRQMGGRDRERAWGGRGTKKPSIACVVRVPRAPALIPPVYYDQIHIVRWSCTCSD